MLLNSVVSIYYYFAVPREMIFKPASDESRFGASRLVTAVVGLAALAPRHLHHPQPLAHMADLSTLIH